LIKPYRIRTLCLETKRKPVGRKVELVLHRIGGKRTSWCYWNESSEEGEKRSLGNLGPGEGRNTTTEGKEMHK